MRGRLSEHERVDPRIIRQYREFKFRSLIPVSADEYANEKCSFVDFVIAAKAMEVEMENEAIKDASNG